MLHDFNKIWSGMFLAGLAFFVMAVYQIRIDQGASLNIAWHVIAYVLITMGEILVSITGLEMAYRHAPEKMKSTLMSFWWLMVFVGNLWTSLISALNLFTGAADFLFYSGFMWAIAVVFFAVTRSHCKEYSNAN